MYFFKTVKEKKEIKVVPLENQVLPSGQPIDTSIYVNCSKHVRESFPVGDIFYSPSLTSVVPSTSRRRYYKSGAMWHLTKESLVYKEYEARYLTDPKKDSDFGKETDEEKKGAPKVEPVTLRSILSSDKSLTAPTSVVDSFYVEPNNWTLLLRNIKNHINTMIIGPTGTGKTSIVKKLCEALKLPLHIFDMGSMVDPISSLLGVHRLERGESIFDYAKFTQVIQEPCVILLDELSRATYSTMNILLPCLDDRRSLNIEIACGKGVREINVHPEVTFIATANVGAEYTGTNSMDRALTNRFFPVELENIPSEEESNVLVSRSTIAKDVAKSIVKVANNLRSLYKKQEVSVCISIRETLLVADLVRDGWEVREAMESVYLPLFEGTKTEGERSTIYKTISSY